MNAPTPPSSSEDGHDPSSSAVLIPLIISMVLVLLGVGVAVCFYVTYRRRYRTWLVEFQARRERERMEAEEREKKERIGPAWWEVEVGDDDDDEGRRWGGASDVEKGWNPVAVTYHSAPSTSPDTNAETAQKTIATDPKLISSTSLSAEEATSAPPRIPEKVEMTVLIAMPSPSPTRSRRSSPESSVPSLQLSPSKGAIGEDETWEEELPEVQLATVMLPVSEDRSGR